MIDEQAVRERIAEVVDPELDQSVSALGFVDGVEIEGTEVTVRLRLPTYWCAANFAYMMAAGLRERILLVEGVERVTVRVEDHFAESELSAGVSAGRSFFEIFPGDADGELEELRRSFTRKAFLIRQEQLLRALLRAGFAPATLARITAADVAVEGTELAVRDGEDGEWRRVNGLAQTWRLWLTKRAALGLASPGADPLFSTPEGEPLPPDGVLDHLRSSRMIRLNGAFNTLLCTGLNRVRHGVDVDADAMWVTPEDPEQEVRPA